MTNNPSSPWFVYILKCADETFYTGITNKIKERLSTHNSGKGAKYTRGRLPVTLVYQEQVEQKGKALQREYAIKQLSRQQKMRLIRQTQTKDEENI